MKHSPGYYPLPVPLSEIVSGTLDYEEEFGIAPGLQITVDFDNSGGARDGILVGESVYGDNWWLSNNSSQFVKDGAPHTGGGHGSNWYGPSGGTSPYDTHNPVKRGLVFEHLAIEDGATVFIGWPGTRWYWEYVFHLNWGGNPYCTPVTQPAAPQSQ